MSNRDLDVDDLENYFLECAQGDDGFQTKKFLAFLKKFPFREIEGNKLLRLIEDVTISIGQNANSTNTDYLNGLRKVLSVASDELLVRIPKMGRYLITKTYSMMDAQNLDLGDEIIPALNQRMSKLINSNSVFNTKQCVAILCSVANLGIRFSSNSFKRISDLMLENMKEITEPKDAIRLLRACAILKLRQKSFQFSELVPALQSQLLKCKFDSFDYKGRSQLYDAQVILGLQIYFNRVASPETASRTEAEFLKKLENVGAVRSPKAEYIPSMRHNIDLGVFWKGRTILIEVDGPYHYIQKAQKGHLALSGYDGGTIMQSAILKASMPEDVIVRVDFRDFEELLLEQKAIRNFLDKCVAMPSGVYQTKPNEFGLAISNILPEARVHETRVFSPTVLENLLQ